MSKQTKLRKVETESPPCSKKEKKNRNSSKNFNTNTWKRKKILKKIVGDGKGKQFTVKSNYDNSCAILGQYRYWMRFAEQAADWKF